MNCATARLAGHSSGPATRSYCNLDRFPLHSAIWMVSMILFSVGLSGVNGEEEAVEEVVERHFTLPRSRRRRCWYCCPSAAMPTMDDGRCFVAVAVVADYPESEAGKQ